MDKTKLSDNQNEARPNASEGAHDRLLAAVIGANDIAREKYSLNDNYGRPRVDYIKKLLAMDDKELRSEIYQMIYHSARCANNYKADWHWMVDACYDVCMISRGDSKIYERAFKECYADHGR